MTVAKRWTTPFVLCAVVSPILLSACSETTGGRSTYGMSVSSLTEAITPSFVRSGKYSERDRACLERAMFFESHRSSRDGMIAVGTVVMNRVRSGKYADTICGVVGQKGQFAPGVLTRSMNSKAMPDVQEAADAVLKGERNSKLKNAMHFHTAGLKFKYKNMHYVTVAGGNAFYEKRGRNWQPLPPEGSSPVMMASAEPAMAPVAYSSAAPTLAPLPSSVTIAPPAIAAPIAQQAGRVVAMSQPAQDKAGMLAGTSLAAPSTDRFGGELTLASAAPSSMMPTQAQADAIGALLLRQGRPFSE